MGYTLDQVAEQFIHALCEIIVFREKLQLDQECPESVILNDAIEDLAKGLGLYCGLETQGDAASGDLREFVKSIRNCMGTLQVAQVFKRTPRLSSYLMAPYFSQTLLQRLE